MDPEQLKQAQEQLQTVSSLLASGDKEQIKQAQQILQGLGYYRGTIDGVLQNSKGESQTLDAVGSFRQSLETAAGNIATTSDAQARTAENDPLNRATKALTDFGPYATGAVAGAFGARKSKKMLDEADTEQTARVSRLAAADDLSPDAAKRELAKVNRGRAAGLGGQFLAPAALFGTAEALRYAGERTGGDLETALNLVASGEQGAGTVMGALQLKDLGKRLRSSPNDPVDAARIGSRGTPPNQPGGGSPPPPRIDPLELEQRFTRDQLRDQAKKAGLQTSGTKTDLATRLAAHDGPIKATAAKPKAIGKAKTAMKALPKPSVLLPAAAGATAADAYLSDAQAANTEVEAGTGAMSEGQPTSASDLAGAGAVGAGVGGATYAGVKGAERAGQALSGTTLGRAAGRAIPGAGAAITAYDLASGINERIPPDATDPVERGARSIPAAGMGMIEMQSGVQGAFEEALSELMSLMRAEGPDQSQGPLVP